MNKNPHKINLSTSDNFAGEIILLKNKEKAPYLGEKFAQDVEPSGYYAIQKEVTHMDDNENYETVVASIKNPLIIDIADDLIKYKRDLSSKYNTKGKNLTKKLLKEGYDAIITTDSSYNNDLGEIIILDPSNMLKKPTKAQMELRKPTLLEKRRESNEPDGRIVYHPTREKNYKYDENTDTVYFQRGNKQWKEMPNEEVRTDIKFIAKHGTKKFKDKLLTDEQREYDLKIQQQANEDSYKLDHQAPDATYGKSGADISDFFSSDIYSADALRLHGHGDPTMDKESIDVIQKIRNNPDEKVTIYRAIPTNLDVKINDKDWITISKLYAIEHGEGPLSGNYKILEKEVFVDEIHTDGNSIHEWGYNINQERINAISNLDKNYKNNIPLNDTLNNLLFDLKANIQKDFKEQLEIIPLKTLLELEEKYINAPTRELNENPDALKDFNDAKEAELKTLTPNELKL